MAKKIAKQSARITKRLVESLEPPAEKSFIVWDTEKKGFGVRVWASGAKTYFVNYRVGREQQRKSIGHHPGLAADDARKRAGKILNRVDDGRDPLAERKREQGQATFRILVERYIAGPCGEKKSGDEDKRIIERDLLKPWGSKTARDIGRREVMALVDGIKDRGAPVMANRTLAVIKRIYNFGIDKDIVEVNPTMRVKPPAKERPRDRVLTDDEIRSFWQNLSKAPGDPQTIAALRLVLTTAARPGEVVALRWEEIDDAGVWTIPSEKSKNELAHRIPLSPLALEVIDSIRRKHDGFIFASPSRPGEPITRHSLSRLLNRSRKILKVKEPFTPHDLRRSAASHMASLGIDRLVIAKILNHVETGITGRVYERYGYDDEKRRALVLWGVKLAEIVAGKKSKVLRMVTRQR